MSDAQISQVTDQTFDSEVLRSPLPVLVDYWAEWCSPCKAIAPILDDLARDYAGRLKIAKLNIDENIETPKRYVVKAIPTLILFKDGDVQAIKQGPVNKSQLSAFIDSNI